MALTVCTFLWGDKYDLDDVLRLRAGLKRHLKTGHRFLCMTERERVIDFPDGIERHAIKDPLLLQVPGCFARLRLFDPGWQYNRKITGTIVCLDLDVVITGGLDALFARDESFVILKGANSLNPCPYNGSVFMFKAGMHADVWSGFSLEAAQTMKYFKFPDDQGWYWHTLPNAATWECGPRSGIYAFQKPGWGGSYSEALPRGARLVVFPGWRSPRQFIHLPWIKDHWHHD